MVQQETRLHSLDAVRAFALLLGIVLHGAMSFMPGLAVSGWPIVDRSQSEFLSGTFFVIHIFRMTTFFVIAGFFAHLLYHRLGPKDFLRNRFKRVLTPLLVGWGILIPATMVVFVWALTRNGAPLTPPPSQAGVFPLMHLWFLWVLCLFYVCALALRYIIVHITPTGFRSGVDRLVAWLTCQPLAIVALCIPVGLCLYFQKGWIAAGGIPTPDMSLIPTLPAFVGYGVAFGFGWLLQRQAAPLTNLCRTRWANFAIAVLLTLAAMVLISDTTTLSGSRRMAFAAIYAMATWSWTFTILGAAAHLMSADRPAIRYLADASYWMYLIHLPLVFALAEAMSNWPMHWSIKFPLLIVTAMTVLLASYHWMVRYTFLGNWLNGKRHTRKLPPTAPALGAAQTADAR